MRVFLTIVRHEVRQTRRDGRFVTMVVSMSVLLVLALMTGRREATEHRRTVEQAQAEQRQRWVAMIAMPPHLAAHAGTTVFRPWPSLAALDPGVNAETGTAIFLEAHKRNFFDHRPAEDRQLPTLFPGTSVAVLLQWLVPLLVFIAAPSLVAFEREHGTWRLALSTGISVRTLAAGKAIGAALPVAALLVPVAVAAAWLGVARPLDLADAPPRTAVLAVAYLGYYVTILFLALAISALASSSKQALGAACGAWMLFVMVVPRIGQEVAQMWAPTPSARAFTEEILKAQSQHPDFFARQEAIVSRLKAEFGVTREIDLPVSPYGLTLYEGEEEETREYQARFARLFMIYATQRRIIRAASLVSPTIAIEAVSSAMAGTDWAHQQDFAEQAEAYRRVLVQTLNRALTDRGAARQYGDADAALYAAVPPFRYQQPPLPFALAHTRGPLALLGVWAAASAALVTVAIRRCGRA